MSEGRQKLYAYHYTSSLRGQHNQTYLSRFPATGGISLRGGLSVALFGFFYDL